MQISNISAHWFKWPKLLSSCRPVAQLLVGHTSDSRPQPATSSRRRSLPLCHYKSQCGWDEKLPSDLLNGNCETFHLSPSNYLPAKRSTIYELNWLSPPLLLLLLFCILLLSSCLKFRQCGRGWAAFSYCLLPIGQPENCGGSTGVGSPPRDLSFGFSGHN